MRFWELTESKWWDDTDYIRLYHGTSSALLPIIEEEGLRPPTKQLDEYALDVLAQYIPPEEWTDELKERVIRRAARIQGGRAGEAGQVIFCMADKDGPSGYARSLAEHGGEIARDVWDEACIFRLRATHDDLDDIPYREFRKIPPPIAPRYANARPVVLELLVPKDWCLFYVDLEHMKQGVLKARAEGRRWAIENSLEDTLDEIFESREVRIARTVPRSMIVAVHEVTKDELVEDADEDFELFHGTSESKDSIRKKGLKPGRLGSVFLTDNPDLAVEYALTDQQRTGRDTVTVVSVKVSDLDQNYLQTDLDHSTAETWQESLSDCDQCMYGKAIPPELLTIEEIEEF